jgi:predicted ATPase/DNA-binding CsgD family transcriptional regulator
MTLGLSGRSPGELPAEVTSFVGRDRELGVLDRLLRAARLVTVTGAPGVGKTRVAVRAAANIAGRFTDGVCFAGLGGLRDPGLLPHTVAACLGLPEQDARPGVDAVADYLRDRRLLLVLDTCEHMLDACGALIEILLNEAPGVTVLTTSRQPLDLPGEHCLPVPPLPIEEPAEDPRGTSAGDAVELFTQRAAAVVPDFAVTAANRDDVVRLCRRLGGVPLAIELAAAHLQSASLGTLAGSLDDRFPALSGEDSLALLHHQTLRAAIQWSYDLCTPAEGLLWSRLSVFAGSFGITAAEEVCAGEPLRREDILPALIGLADKSVVLRAGEDGAGAGEDDARYRLLDSIREFGAERLAADGADADVRARHVAWFAGKAAAFAEHAKDGDQLPRFRELRREHADIRAALGYALAAPDGDRIAARLAADLRPYWEISGLVREGRHWLARILERFPAPSPERAWLLLTAGVLATFQGEHETAIADLEAAVAIAAEHGEELAGALGHAYLCLAFVFTGRAAAAAAAGAVAGERLGALDHFGGLVSLDIHMSYLHLLSGEPEAAIERCERGLRRLGGGDDGGERWARGYLYVIMGTALFLRGETRASSDNARRALRLKHELGDAPGTAYCLEALALLASAEQRDERVTWLHGAASVLWERTGKPFGGNNSLRELLEEVIVGARGRLGEGRYERLFADGAGRALDVVVTSALNDDSKLPPPRGQGLTSLTRRQSEIAELAARGLTSGQIAEQLVISRRTVDAHIAHIYSKLGISSRSQLAAMTAAELAAR